MWGMCIMLRKLLRNKILSITLSLTLTLPQPHFAYPGAIPGYGIQKESVHHFLYFLHSTSYQRPVVC